MCFKKVMLRGLQVRRKVLGYDEPEFMPDFTQCVDKFAIHAGKHEPL